MSNKYTSVYDWLKYIKANVVGINLRELRLNKSAVGKETVNFIVEEEIKIDLIYTTLQLLKKSNAQGTFRSIISLQINPYERE